MIVVSRLTFDASAESVEDAKALAVYGGVEARVRLLRGRSDGRRQPWRLRFKFTPAEARAVRGLLALLDRTYRTA